MLDYLQHLGRTGLDVAAGFGRAGILLAQAVWGPIDWRYGPGLLLRQLHFVGVYSLIIIVVSGVLIGMVLALQGYTVLVRFGAESALGQMVSLTLLRELGVDFAQGNHIAIPSPELRMGNQSRPDTSVTPV